MVPGSLDLERHRGVHRRCCRPRWRRLRGSGRSLDRRVELSPDSRADQPTFARRNQGGRRLILDCGRPDAYNSGFINYWTTQPGAVPIHLREDPAIGALHYLVECLLHGATTVVDVGGGSAPLVEAAHELGVRIFTSPGFASAKYVDGTGVIEYDWDDGRGRSQLDTAVAFVREHADGNLINGMLCPHAVDTCSSELLGATMDAARALGVPVQIHAAQDSSKLAR